MRFTMQIKFFGLFSAFLFAVCLAAVPAQADSLFTVSGVHVDASAASSAEAYTIALQQGRPKAWTILYRRLTRQQDWSRQPALDTATLDRISRGYTIAHERRSTTRYVADVTYMFSPGAVERILRAADIAYIGAAAKRILVVAMAPGYARGAWAAALADPRFHDSVVPFTVAGGADQAALAGMAFNSANWSQVGSAAAQIHASEAALVQIVPGGNHVTVNVRRLASGAPAAQTSIAVPMAKTLQATYPAAADAAVSLIQDMWKEKSAVDFNLKGNLVADLRVSTLAQWGRVQSVLAGVDTVTGVTVEAMNIGEARIAIAYTGNLDQLKDALGAQGLSLVSQDGGWILSPNFSSGSP